jgi:hypothetical protein
MAPLDSSGKPVPETTAAWSSSAEDADRTLGEVKDAVVNEWSPIGKLLQCNWYQSEGD